MKKYNQRLNIGILLLLLPILFFGCGKESAEIHDLQVDVTFISEAYIGESSYFVVNVSKKCDITMYVDGGETYSVSNTTMRYDVSTLPLGVHTVKISVADGFGTYDRTFQCKILERYVVPTIQCTKIESCYQGESAVVTATTKIDSKMILFVDGVNMLSSSSRKLTFDVSTLSVGTHQIKIVAQNGDKSDEVEFECKVNILVDLSKGLVAYYPFDTDANDYSGNGNHGTVTNLSLVSGVNGSAYNFAGVDNPGWIQVPNSETLQFDDATSFSMWFKVNSCRGMDGWASAVDYGGAFKLFAKDYDRGELYGGLNGLEENKWGVDFWGICYERDNCGAEFEGSVLNYWYHVVYVATKTNLKVYLDGKLVATKEYESDFALTNSKDLWIGRMYGGFAYYFNGKIDEFRVYNRALNSEEVGELYNMYDPVDEPEIPEVSSSYVDLGLPSGTLWATCNVGAENPWDYGDYYAWGEVTTKVEYSSDTYTFNDNPSTLDAQHDAATTNLGSNWRMPTKDEFQELLDNCEIEWTSDYQGTGVAGCIVWDTYSHSTHIFLPASGYRRYGDRFGVRYYGLFLSSSVYDSNGAWGGYFDSGCVKLDNYDRYYGFSVRPVRCKN